MKQGMKFERSLDSSAHQKGPLVVSLADILAQDLDDLDLGEKSNETNKQEVRKIFIILNVCGMFSKKIWEEMLKQ